MKPLPDEAETTQTSKASSFDVERGDGPGNFNAQDGLCSRSFGGCDFKSIPFVFMALACAPQYLEVTD